MTPGPTARFMDWYAGRMQRKAQSSAEKIRTIQGDTGRTREQPLELVVYSMDVRHRNRIKQDAWVRTYRFRADGTTEVLAPGTGVDAIVMTDFPTVAGIARGKQDRVTRDGTVIHDIEFTVFDAVRLGHVVWEGNSTALRNLVLLQERIMPELARELRIA